MRIPHRNLAESGRESAVRSLAREESEESPEESDLKKLASVTAKIYYGPESTGTASVCAKKRPA